MTHFVADNLEYRIKIASPSSSKKGKNSVLKRIIQITQAIYWNRAGIDERASRNDSRNYLPTESATAQLQHKFLSSVPQIDANALNDIEMEAQYLAANIDGLTENLCNLLHSVSLFINGEQGFLIWIQFDRFLIFEFEDIVDCCWQCGIA